MDNWLLSIYTDGSSQFVSNPFPKKGEEVEIKVRLWKNSPIRCVIFRTKLNGAEILQKMVYGYEENGLVYYKTKIKCYEDCLHYRFYFPVEDQIYYYNQYQITSYMPNEYYDFKIIMDYNAPKWVRESVFYQIFPDRFYNGNKENDVKSGEYSFNGYETIQVKDFNETPKEYEESHCLDFYGGDLEGIKEKIPYLKKLGVTALYLNPIFYAATVHHYDCLDFFQVDPHFGGDKALIELSKELHKEGMRIILDVSINHTGIAHKWFNRDGEFFDKGVGAYNNPDSPERDYYFFDQNNSYKAWAGVETLPTLNYTSKSLREILFLGKDSMTKHFLKKPFDIDGWRFDVADVMARNDLLQLHHSVWPEINVSIKSVKKDAYILAEDWGDSEEFLHGNEWDSAMNYFGCSRVIREFLGEGDLFNKRSSDLSFNVHLDGEGFINRIKEHLCQSAFQMQENNFNLLDSHDVPRLHNDPKISWDGVRLANIVMFTLIGAPSVYYGDEIKLEGHIKTNEGCRYPMHFDSESQNSDSFHLFHRLMELKQTEAALKYGGMKYLNCNQDVFSFARVYGKETIICVGSNDKEDLWIDMPLAIFGNQYRMPEIDLLGLKMKIINNGNDSKILVKAKKTYLFKLIGDEKGE